jgi:hypothetical protein
MHDSVPILLVYCQSYIFFRFGLWNMLGASFRFFGTWAGAGS